MTRWTIERAHFVKASAHFNAPIVPQWRYVGAVRASGYDSAMLAGMKATGAPRGEVRVAENTFKP